MYRVEHPLISIIVPVYNCEKYLATCIRSIISSNTIDLELILINDGSTDDSLKIAEYFSQNDSRIKILTQVNSGPSAARNLGLEIAQGKWIAFIDADDWINNDFFNIISSAKDCDLIYFGHFNIYPHQNVPQQITITDFQTAKEIDKILLNLLNSPELFFGFTCNKFYRRALIGNLRFDETLSYKEDELFTIEYCRGVKSIYISSKLPYFYRIHPTSLSHNEKRIRYYFNLGLKIELSLYNYPWLQLKKELLCRCNQYFRLGLREYQFHSHIMFCGKAKNIQDVLEEYDRFCLENRSIEIIGKRQWIISFCPIKYFRLLLRLNQL